MTQGIGEQGGFSEGIPLFEAGPDTLTVQPTFFDGAPFETTPDGLIKTIADLYEDGRDARSAGDGGMWAACFHEAHLILDAHRYALNDDQIDALKERLAAASYYEQGEMQDPYRLGPVAQQEA